jgi:hypothetical protein
MFRTGARHLYLLDFDGSNLPELRKTIISQYPDVKVLYLSLSIKVNYLRLCFQVTTIQGDASDETLISDVCKRSIDEEGRLDVFFANVCLKSRY